MLLCHAANAEIEGVLAGGDGTNDAVGSTVKFQVMRTGDPPAVAWNVALNWYGPGIVFAETRNLRYVPPLAAFAL